MKCRWTARGDWRRDLERSRKVQPRPRADTERGRQSLSVSVDGPLIVDDAEIQVRAALDGVGVVWTLEHYAAPFISAGRLVRVLEGWCQAFPGYFLYYPSRRLQPPALSALIETLRLQR